MPTKMPLRSRRIFRLSLTVALALTAAYALQLPLPYLAPMVALMLTVTPAPPMGAKTLAKLFVLVMITLGMGLLLTPLLTYYPASALLIVAAGLFLSNDLSINKGQELIGVLLTVGLTMITAAGTAGSALALAVIHAMFLGIGLAVVCQWIVYPWFPEDAVSAGAPKGAAPNSRQSIWMAWRATLIVMPAYLLALTNPSNYLAIIMKAVTLGQQSSTVSARSAGRELLGSTFLGGCFAGLFWCALRLFPHLWMFFWCMALVGIYIASKIYGLISSRLPASYWVNTATTMLILLGPAVEDSAGGKDVYKAFAVRMGLFIAVTLYAWTAILALEYLRARRDNRGSASLPDEGEVTAC